MADRADSGVCTLGWEMRANGVESKIRLCTPFAGLQAEQMEAEMVLDAILILGDRLPALDREGRLTPACTPSQPKHSGKWIQGIAGEGTHRPRCRECG